jgi:cell wall-associated NlpC family hydrolase
MANGWAFAEGFLILSHQFTHVRVRILVTLQLLLLVGCASQPKPPPPARSTPVNLAVVRDALSLKGVPYRWGEETPQRGFDCSGLVHYVYGRQGVRLPRTARAMANAMPSLGYRFRRPGDLVFFNTTGKPFSHVGIYIGGDDFVHASSARGRVVVSSLGERYWTEHFLGMRRPGPARSLQIGRWIP